MLIRYGIMILATAFTLSSASKAEATDIPLCTNIMTSELDHAADDGDPASSHRRLVDVLGFGNGIPETPTCANEWGLAYLVLGEMMIHRVFSHGPDSGAGRLFFEILASTPDVNVMHSILLRQVLYDIQWTNPVPSFVVDALISRGANGNATPQDQQNYGNGQITYYRGVDATAIAMLAGSPQPNAIVVPWMEGILRNGADPNAFDGNSIHKPLEKLVRSGHSEPDLLERLKLMERYGANLEWIKCAVDALPTVKAYVVSRGHVCAN